MRHKIQWDFEILTNKLILARRSDIAMIYKKKKKKTCGLVDLAVPTVDRMKIIENEKRDKY